MGKKRLSFSILYLKKNDSFIPFVSHHNAMYSRPKKKEKKQTEHPFLCNIKAEKMREKIVSSIILYEKKKYKEAVSI